MKISNIRNFSIIAHIDHGKSTLSDRLLEESGALKKGEGREQFLDKMELEREKGITIKATSVRLTYKAKDGEVYALNLIDTPGHVDFSYEVSRSLSACEGAILVVDATQGVEAQTLAHLYTAVGNGLEVITVINKIDLPNADTESIKMEIQDTLGLDPDGAILTSAKEGTGIKEILEGIVSKLPPPEGEVNASLKALIFDSWYDAYQGAITMIRIFEGRIKKGMLIRLMSSSKSFEVDKVGVLDPYPMEVEGLSAGEVGFMIAGIKDVIDTKIGDTVTEAKNPTDKPFPGFKVLKPMVFSGLYPIESTSYDSLKKALEKLSLNDSSFFYEPESSLALGFGFRCGFLGLLHMEIIQERLEREYGIELITTAPTVISRVTDVRGKVHDIENPDKLPPSQEIARIEEPYILATIHLKKDSLGQVISLCEDRRGTQKEIKFSGTNRVILVYEMPLNEVVMEFYDRLKAVSRGYASLDYEHIGFRKADLVKVDILLNGEKIDAISFMAHREKAYYRGRELVEKMKEVIPRQMFEVAIQAAIGNRVIARESVRPLRKQVTAKCYGGDITRKRKLLQKQKEGKKRMKRIGRIDVPQEAFLAVLRVGS
ncbi:MAG: translation elongation factor 4 [Thermodesulfobacteriota bacterium]